MKTLGLVMIVKNEERCLAKCLDAVKDLVDKIYITDTGSTDKTKEIAASYGAILSDYVWNQDFSAARNFSLAQSDCDWNLVLDADEYLVSGKKEDILQFIEKGNYIGALQRQDSYKEANGEVSRSYSYITRLFPKGTRYEGRVHEQEIGRASCRERVYREV